MKKRVVITGSSGFIGSHLVRNLISCGYDVWGIDIRRPNVDVPGFTFRRCDILRFDDLRKVMEEIAPQVVIHLAARTDLDGRKLTNYAVNTDGVNNLVSVVASAANVERVLYTSSQLVCRVGYIPNNESEYCPNTVYGESKVITETIVRERDGGGKIWCLIRPTTIWGPGMNVHYQRFFRLVAQNRYFFVTRRPLFKSYGYVGNAVCQLKMIAEAPSDQIHGEMFYLADYQPLALRDWVSAIQRELGARPIPTIPLPLARILAWVGDVLMRMGYSSFPFNSFRLNNILTEYRFDMEKTESVCGELPYRVEEGVKELSEWIRMLIRNAD